MGVFIGPVGLTCNGFEWGWETSKLSNLNLVCKHGNNQLRHKLRQDLVKAAGDVTKFCSSEILFRLLTIASEPRVQNIS